MVVLLKTYQESSSSLTCQPFHDDEQKSADRANKEEKSHDSILYRVPQEETEM